MRNAILAIFTFAYLGAVDLETSNERDNFQRQGHHTVDNGKILNNVLSHIKTHYNTFNVNVFVNSGEVTIKGTIGTEADKQALENEIKGLAGVTSVKNELQVK